LFDFAVLLSMGSVGLGQIFVVENAASNIPQVTPGSIANPAPVFANSSIAQGAMFVVKGNGLGPKTVAIASAFPLQTSLAGTSIQIVSGGKTVDAIIYYTQAEQVAAILPSATPPGTGSLKLSYNGSTYTLPITVTQSNVAMYTVGQVGAGDAVVTLADNSLILPNNAPNPGDTVVFWADGLGPVSFDETVPAQAGDMTSVPLEVFIGGQAAKVLYRGRNPCCVSLDQINIQIPQGVSGCVVSVIMRIGALVSNATTMPIASTGRVCTPTNPAISQSDVQRLMAKQTLNIGNISLVRSNPKPDFVDGATATFQRFSALSSLVLDTLVDIPAPGSCTVTYSAKGGFTDPTTGLQRVGLDAGTGMSILGASGNTVTTLQGGTGDYGTNSGQYFQPGAYSVQGAGGADVGSFNVAVTMGPPPVLTNLQSVTIERTQNFTISWTGGDPSGYATITGVANDAPGGDAYFNCTARSSDGTFTVPAPILQSLPANSNGSLQVQTSSPITQFTVNGLDLGIAWASEATYGPVATYQ